MFNLNAVLCFILAACVITSVASELDRRIVALGDLHGDLPNTLAILKFANIIDEEHHWIGGDAIFVQTVNILKYRLITDINMCIPCRVTLWTVVLILSNYMN